MMKRDILHKEDLEVLVNCFYDKVKKDNMIGPFFSDISKENWEAHLLRMYRFWENVLFYTGDYSGNPMQHHLIVHTKHSFRPGDFEQWTKLFNETVDELFEGNNAELIKQKAQSIGTILQIKIIS